MRDQLGLLIPSEKPVSAKMPAGAVLEEARLRGSCLRLPLTAGLAHSSSIGNPHSIATTELIALLFRR